MQSLDDFNKMMQRAYNGTNHGDPQLNGIACPDCGAELWDTHPNRRLASNPPQMDVHCLSCGYRGYRLA